MIYIVIFNFWWFNKRKFSFLYMFLKKEIDLYGYVGWLYKYYIIFNVVLFKNVIKMCCIIGEKVYGECKYIMYRF